jgi:hypothetical protein
VPKPTPSNRRRLLVLPQVDRNDPTEAFGLAINKLEGVEFDDYELALAVACRNGPIRLEEMIQATLDHYRAQAASTPTRIRPKIY